MSARSTGSFLLIVSIGNQIGAPAATPITLSGSLRRSPAGGDVNGYYPAMGGAARGQAQGLPVNFRWVHLYAFIYVLLHHYTLLFLSPMYIHQIRS